MAVGFLLFVIGSRTIATYWGIYARMLFTIVVGIGQAYYIHGNGVIWHVVVALVNWSAATKFAGRRLYPICLWMANLMLVLAASYYRGFSFASIFEFLSFLDLNKGKMRWHRVSNLRMLSALSYCIDLHWSRQGKPVTRKDIHMEKCAECSHDVT
jgi:hypothetical protein